MSEQVRIAAGVIYPKQVLITQTERGYRVSYDVSVIQKNELDGLPRMEHFWHDFSSLDVTFEFLRLHFWTEEERQARSEVINATAPRN